jgi:transcriptional regulator with XRE-family HTH domain
MPTRYREQSPLGQQLTRMRCQCKLTQKQLARQSGLSKAIIQSLEQGVRRDPRLSTVVRLAKALHITLNELVPTQREASSALES